MLIKTVRKDRIIFFIFALSVLFTGYPYFTWDSYGNNWLKYFIKIFRYVGMGMMLLYLANINISKNFKNVNGKTFFLTCFLITLIMQMSYAGANYFIIINRYGVVILLTFLICFALSCKERSHLYEIFMKLFALFTVPSIIYYLLAHIIGFNINHAFLASDHLGKIASGTFYELRPLGLIINSPWTLPRPCGIFDEPGVVGTICAFLVAINWGCVMNRKWTYLLVLEGVLSISMAFYALMLIFFMIRLYNKGLMKSLITVVGLVLALFCFANINFTNPQLQNLQRRVDFSSAFLIRDNRTSESFENVYNDFIQRGGYALIMGEGIGASTDNVDMMNASSYKRIIYDHGIFGATLYFGFIVLIYLLKYGIDKYSFPFFVVFIASLYQRPGINEMTLFIYITGFAYIALNKESNLVKPTV